MQLNSIFTITVNRTQPPIQRRGYGTPLVYGRISTGIIPPAERVREYNTRTFATDMVADGFTTNDPVYKAVAQIAAQASAPTTVKVGRGALSFTHAVELTPRTFATGDSLSVTITKGTTSRTYPRTCGGVSLAAEATALALDMNNDASGWGTAGTAELTIAGVGDDVEIDAISPANDNEMWYYSSLSNISFTDVGTDRGVATDLIAINAADNDWYGLVLADAFGATEIAAAAGWVESNYKLMVAATQDTQAITAGTGIIATLSSASRERTASVYAGAGLEEYPAAAIMGLFLSQSAGEVSWSYKSLSGVTHQNLTAAQIAYLDGKDCNHYTTTAGVGNLLYGRVASGSNISMIHLTDWVVGTIQEDLLTMFRSVGKVPFTDAGVSKIEGVVRNVLRRKMPLGFAQGTDTFSAPRVADVALADKQSNILRDVTFGATFAGEILKLSITANLQL